MRRCLIVMLATASWIGLAATPAFAGGAPTSPKPASFVAFGVFALVVCLVIVVPVCSAIGAARRPSATDRVVEGLEPVVQQSLVDRERGQEPDHVVVGPRLQDHDAFLEAAPDDRVPVRTA
jgi:hypothetical protein